MATLATGAPCSAFTLSDHGGLGLVPINSALVPASLQKSFALPRVDFSLAGCGAAIPPPFRLPLPFTGEEMNPGVHTQASTKEQLPSPVALELSRPCVSGGAQLETLPMSAILVDQGQASDENAKPLHKPRVVWTEELHQRFLRAIEAAGSDEAAVPTVILKLMNVSGLSRDNVASHLQKYRLGLKRGKTKKRRTTTVSSTKQKQARTMETAVAQLKNPDPVKASTDVMASAAAREWQISDAAAAAPAAGAVNPRTTSNRQKSGDSGVIAGAVAEGEGQDCAGSNERDDDGCNDGPSSDDGAGASSDNRNSACNVSAAEHLPADTAKAGAHAHVAAQGSGPNMPGIVVWPAPKAVPFDLRPEPTAGAIPEGVGSAPREAAHGAENIAAGAGAVKPGGTGSPDDSRSMSNNASKQGWSNANGVSDVLGSVPTAGSGTGIERMKAAGSPHCDLRVPHPDHPTPASRPPTTSANVSAAEPEMPSAARGVRIASRDLSGMQPVGMPMSLPMPPRVPPANAAPMRAPRLGDHT